MTASATAALRGLIAVSCLAGAACGGPGETHDTPRPEPVAPETGDWVRIFDGETLTGWTPKIAGYPLGENFGDTFRVEDGSIVVSYDQYENSFAERFGVLYYDTPYSYYRLRLEYRFVGDQLNGGPQWARRNSGVLYHAQPPETVPLDNGTPISLEAQLLAGDAVADGTGNLCTPETSVVIDGAREHEHCLTSTSGILPAGVWTAFELAALPDGTFRHYINGEEVFMFSGPEYDEEHPWADGLAITGGWFTLQSESHPVEFRNIELMVLEE